MKTLSNNFFFEFFKIFKENTSSMNPTIRFDDESIEAARGLMKAFKARQRASRMQAVT
jgi:hypothetical protein